MGECRFDSSGPREGSVKGSCKHGNEPSGSIKCRNCLASWATPSFSRGTQLHEIIFSETSKKVKQPVGYLGKMYKS